MYVPQPTYVVTARAALSRDRLSDAVLARVRVVLVDIYDIYNRAAYGLRTPVGLWLGLSKRRGD
jgi:hypothetical protein